MQVEKLREAVAEVTRTDDDVIAHEEKLFPPVLCLNRCLELNDIDAWPNHVINHASYVDSLQQSLKDNETTTNQIGIILEVPVNLQ